MKTEARLPLIFVILCAAASAYAFAVVFTTPFHPGAIGLNYIGLGTDYMVFHAAIRLAHAGDLATLYNPTAITAFINHLYHPYLSAPLSFRPWLYPPSFLVLLLPFRALPFLASYASFMLGTVTLMRWALGTIRPALGGLPGLLVCFCPAASIAVVSGQTSFLVAALLIGGTATMRRQPWLAGLLFGLLSFKPQFFILVPAILLAAGAWRAIAATAFTAAALAAAAAVLFGPAIWTHWVAAFLASQSSADPRWLISGRLWGESVYACVFLLTHALPGGGASAARIAQDAAILFAAWTVVVAMRKALPTRLRVAAVLAAAQLAAPHSGAYDLLLLVAAFALVVFGAPAGSWTRHDRILGLVIWLLPLFGLPATSVVARFTPLVCVWILWAVLWRRPAAWSAGEATDETADEHIPLPVSHP